jgi:hypothetical protein
MIMTIAIHLGFRVLGLMSRVVPMTIEMIPAMQSAHHRSIHMDPKIGTIQKAIKRRNVFLSIPLDTPLKVLSIPFSRMSYNALSVFHPQE